MKEGSTIINTTSVNAFKGNAKLLDYTATKGAILAFTRGLALQLIDRGIRVNGQLSSHSNPNCKCNSADLCSDNPHLWKKAMGHTCIHDQRIEEFCTMFGLCISTVILNSKKSSRYFASFVFMDYGINQVLLHVFCIICIPLCSCNVK
jgi:hypothetical protein